MAQTGSTCTCSCSTRWPYSCFVRHTRSTNYLSFRRKSQRPNERKGKSATWHWLRVIWRGSLAGLYTIAGRGVGKGRQFEFLDEIEVFADQQLRVSSGLGDLFQAHAGVLTK